MAERSGVAGKVNGSNPLLSTGFEMTNFGLHFDQVL
jgi:hypothetical protein